MEYYLFLFKNKYMISMIYSFFNYIYMKTNIFNYSNEKFHLNFEYIKTREIKSYN